MDNAPTQSDVTQADRTLAEEWRFIECMSCSEYMGEFVDDLAADIARHRIEAIRQAKATVVVEAFAKAADIVQSRYDKAPHNNMGEQFAAAIDDLRALAKAVQS